MATLWLNFWKEALAAVPEEGVKDCLRYFGREDTLVEVQSSSMARTRAMTRATRRKRRGEATCSNVRVDLSSASEEVVSWGQSVGSGHHLYLAADSFPVSVICSSPWENILRYREPDQARMVLSVIIDNDDYSTFGKSESIMSVLQATYSVQGAVLCSQVLSCGGLHHHAEGPVVAVDPLHARVVAGDYGGRVVCRY